MTRLRYFARFVAALLRELADERAYQRCLASCGRTESPAEWRRFADERYKARFARPKCC